MIMNKLTIKEIKNKLLEVDTLDDDFLLEIKKR